MSMGTNRRRFLRCVGGVAVRSWAWATWASCRGWGRSPRPKRPWTRRSCGSSRRSSPWSACWKRPRATGCSRRWPRGSSRGSAYRDLVAALLLAGVRNVQPRPSVGHKFHAVLVVNSAHLASLASPDTDRWLPIFWALDYFKDSQARDVSEGNWTMAPVDESAVPPARRAKAAFTTAMDHWDEAAADAAIAGLARSAGTNEIYEIFFRYGARDFRSIGHKAIYVANSLRTLQCIGWQHAEPVLRSLAYALLESQRRRQPRRARLRGRPVVAAQPGPLGQDQGGLDRRQPDRGRLGRPARHAPPGLRRRGVRPGGRALEPRGRPAVDLGCPVRRGGRAAAPPAGDRLVARGDHDQRTPFRVPGQWRRPDPPAAHAAERRVPAPVPRRHGGPRQGARGADRSARAARIVERLARGRSRRSSPTPAATG